MVEWSVLRAPAPAALLATRIAVLVAAPACAPLPSASIESGGRERTYRYVIPSDGGAGRPLVVALHGRFGDGQDMERLTGLASIARRERFVLLLPDGVERSWADARDAGPAFERGVDDLAFLVALVDRAIAEHGVDPRRVYLAGMSNGGLMAQTLACRASDRVAGVFSVAASAPANLARGCALSHAMPIAFVHGDEDPIVPFEGGALGDGAGGEVLSADASARLFAALAACADDPTLERFDRDAADGTRVTRATHRGCDGAAEVRLDVVGGGGHTWPGGRAFLPQGIVGRVSRELDASEEAWSFLSRFSSPAP